MVSDHHRDDLEQDWEGTKCPLLEQGETHTARYGNLCGAP